METIPSNCLRYRSNICGTFKLFKNNDSTYRLEYDPSGMFVGRGLSKMTLNNLTLENYDRSADDLKNIILDAYNKNK